MENKVIVNIKDNGMVDVIEFSALAFEFPLEASETFFFEKTLESDIIRSRSMCNSCVFKVFDSDDGNKHFISELYYRFIKSCLEGTPATQINNLNTLIQKMLEEYGYKPLLERMKEIIKVGNEHGYDDNPRMMALYSDLYASMKVFNTDMIKMEEDLLVLLSIHYFSNDTNDRVELNYNVLETLNNISESIYQLSLKLFTILINMDKYVRRSTVLIDEFIDITQTGMESSYEVALNNNSNFKKIFVSSLVASNNNISKGYCEYRKEEFKRCHHRGKRSNNCVEKLFSKNNRK